MTGSLRIYWLTANSQSWSGSGFTLGTPWWAVAGSEHWQWQADVSLLQLSRLRLAALGGSLTYKGGNAYDVDLWSQRSNHDISGRFLPPSGTAGSGASASLAMQGRPWPEWRVSLRADDLTSTLQWNDLATDANTLQSANTTRRPDGYLDYSPFLKGNMDLRRAVSHIAPRWQLAVSHSLTPGTTDSPELSLQLSQQAGISQSWVNWRSAQVQSAGGYWGVALEPHWPSLKLQATWRGWQLTLASDGKGGNTQYRRFQLCWQSSY